MFHEIPLVLPRRNKPAPGAKFLFLSGLSHRRIGFEDRKRTNGKSEGLHGSGERPKVVIAEREKFAGSDRDN